MKTLCLYYSRTDLTRDIMKKMADLLDADLVEYTDGVNRKGALGYLRSCIDSFKKPKAVKCVGGEPDWDVYDTVIVGMPVWAEKPCVVGRGFLQQYSGKFHGDVYLVVTHMAKADYEKAILKTYDFSAVRPAGHLSLQTKDHDPSEKIRQFAGKLTDGE